MTDTRTQTQTLTEQVTAPSNETEDPVEADTWLHDHPHEADSSGSAFLPQDGDTDAAIARVAEFLAAIQNEAVTHEQWLENLDGIVRDDTHSDLSSPMMTAEKFQYGTPTQFEVSPYAQTGMITSVYVTTSTTNLHVMLWREDPHENWQIAWWETAK